MKKRDLESKLRSFGWWLSREGGNHEIWTNGKETEPVPRHKEIAEPLVKKILRKAEAHPGVKGEKDEI
ncbi:MAG: type II toxin-antitoxin system HicA family toxin [Candidatus Eremiobacteraeota bacterium]|nr:type II toxin-antitoxin system HicA family toxin [Candidatus Eremiobacteraeota bacterium]MCL5054728.1 type II toxin-antitoxin system HicA family toxin [Bacillota bacterium]